MDEAEILEIREISAQRPNYYRGRSGRDVIDIINDLELDYTAGTVVAYVVRAGRKPGNSALADLRKAREHLDRRIKYLEAERG